MNFRLMIACTLPAVAVAALLAPASAEASVKTADTHSVSHVAYQDGYLYALSDFVRAGNGKAIRYAYTGNFSWDYFSNIGVPDGTGPGTAVLTMNPDGSLTDVENYAGLQRLMVCGPIKKSTQKCFIKEPGSSTWYVDNAKQSILNNPQLDFLMGEFSSRQVITWHAPTSNVKTAMTKEGKYPMRFTLVSMNDMFPDFVSRHESVISLSKYTTRGEYSVVPRNSYSVKTTHVPVAKITFPKAGELGPKPAPPELPAEPTPAEEPTE